MLRGMGPRFLTEKLKQAMSEIFTGRVILCFKELTATAQRNHQKQLEF
jgi:hypothetical protein